MAVDENITANFSFPVPLIESFEKVIEEPCNVEDDYCNLTQSAELFLKACESIIFCPDKECGFAFEKAPGVGDFKDLVLDDGEKASEKASLHYAEYRFRCRKCDKDFCSNCNTIPYHNGYTCQEFQERKINVICRFCEEVVEKNAVDEEIAHCNDCASVSSLCNHEKHECSHYSHFHYGHNENARCLHSDCVEPGTQNLDDFCAICGVDALRRFPLVSIRGCNHVFHQKCLQERFQKSSNPISLNFYCCPLCNVDINYGVDDGLLRKFDALKGDLLQRIPPILEEYKIDLSMAEDDPKYVHEGLKKLNFYSCFKCKSVYFGGLHECGEQIVLPDEEMICGGCRGCDIHGSDHMIYKCRFCCDVATYFCFGHTHFCTPCHDNAWGFVHGAFNNFLKSKAKPCGGPGKCPLDGVHAPNGEEFVIGCGACRDKELSGVDFDRNFNHPPARVEHRPNNVVHEMQHGGGRVIEGANAEDDFAARRQVRIRNPNEHWNRFLPNPVEDQQAPVKVFVPRQRNLGNRIAGLMAKFQ